jgi:hypothetical protein
MFSLVGINHLRLKIHSFALFIQSHTNINIISPIKHSNRQLLTFPSLPNKATAPRPWTAPTLSLSTGSSTPLAIVSPPTFVYDPLSSTYTFT